jgi:microtubule-associated protein-like 6
VIYDLKAKTQRHYRGHRNQIISIAVEGTLSATGDYSSQPEIRIWDYRSLETVQIIKGFHIKGVHLLKFLGEGLLISCGCEK